MFNSSTTLLRTDRQTRTIACNVTRLPEFLSRSVTLKEIMEVLLLHLFRHHICCHLGEAFVTYMFQIFNSYETIRLYVALNDSPLQNLFFYSGGDAEYFRLEGFEFTLLDHDFVNDIMTYDFKHGESCASLIVCVIDSVDPCGPESNVDFVHFVWDNSENFSFLRHFITVLHPPDYIPHYPNSFDSQPQTLCLAHHRGESEGWNLPSRGAWCAVDRRINLHPLTYYCKAPDLCQCFVCRRQPPFLAVSAASILLRYTFKFELFQLRHDTT